ncbi:ComF family protein, partial [Actinomadura sp. KC06]|uniref:ComF family protein n=1 Tax=Actinomadura sp. KC06 TaxID=2530369 RepID=UPI0010525D7F
MNLLADLIDLLLPERCAGCGGEPVLLCDACAVPLQGPARPARTAPDGLPPPWTVATYDGPLRTILSAYKERGRTALAVPLGEALATAIQAALTSLDPPQTVVCVPSRRGTIRRRGHDPLREMVAVALHRLRADGIPITSLDALRQRRRVGDQAGLTAAQRLTNLDGALETTSPDLAGRQVILVDDVITTGASLAEAARALRAAGATPTAASAKYCL